MSDDNYLLDDGTYAGIGKSAFIDDDCPPLTAEELEFVEQFEDECTAAEFVALDEVSKVVLEFKRIERWADE